MSKEEIQKLKTQFTRYTNNGDGCEKYIHNEEDYFRIEIDENNNTVYQLNGEHECYGVELNNLEDFKIRFKSFTGVELVIQTIVNEKYNQIINEAWYNFLRKKLGHTDDDYRISSLEEFVNKIKTDDEFSKKWGLKIEERELSLEERAKIYGVEKINTTNTGYYENSYAKLKVDQANIPTKLITVIYNNETIQIYE